MQSFETDTIAAQGNKITRIAQRLYDFEKNIKVSDEPKFITIRPNKPRLGGNPQSHRPRNPNDYVLRGFKLPDTQEWVGRPIGVNDDGTYIWKRLNIKGSKTFNLAVAEDAYEYFIWKQSLWYKGSKMSLLCGMDQQNLLVTDDPEAEAELAISRKITAREIEGQILDMPSDDIKDWGLIFKLDPNSNSPNRIKHLLLQKLQADPEKFKKDLEINGDQEFLAAKITLRKAMFAGIVKEEVERGVIYKETRVLGHNEETAIKNLMKDIQFYGIIEAEANEKLPTSNVRSITKKEYTREEPTGEKNYTKQEVDDLVESKLQALIAKHGISNGQKESETPVNLEGKKWKDMNAEERAEYKRLKALAQEEKEDTGDDPPSPDNTISE